MEQRSQGTALQESATLDPPREHLVERVTGIATRLAAFETNITAWKDCLIDHGAPSSSAVAQKLCAT